MTDGRYVSIRVETRNRLGRTLERRHDLRLAQRQPDNIDAARTHLNSVIIEPPSARELVERVRAWRQAAGKASTLRKDAVVAVAGIITFSADAQPVVDALTAEAQDEQFLRIAQAVAVTLDAELIGLAVHRDEHATHAHFELLGVDHLGNPVSKKLNKMQLRQLQDVAGVATAPLGITRGVRVRDRRSAGEPFSKTVHRTVQELRRDLPLELERTRETVRKARARLADAESLLARRGGESARVEARIKRQAEKVAKLQAEAARLEATAEQVMADHPAPRPAHIERVTKRVKRGLLPDALETQIVRVVPAKESQRAIEALAARVAKAEDNAAVAEARAKIASKVASEAAERAEIEAAERMRLDESLRQAGAALFGAGLPRPANLLLKAAFDAAAWAAVNGDQAQNQELDDERTSLRHTPE
jgi:hypothetical protein